MKNIFAVFFILIFSFFTSHGQYILTNADVVVKDGVLIRCDFISSKLIIPNYLDGQKVTAIGERVFWQKNLTSVILPSSITSIGNSAFSNNSLTSIILPDSLTIIGNFVFSNNSLTSITLPSSLTDIGSSAFSGNSLNSVVLPEGLISIKGGTFSNNSLSSISLPEGLLSIEGSAFAHNSLTNITLPEGLISIEASAFYNNSLTYVTLPSGLTSIERNAFAYNDLTTVSLPHKLTYIGKNAFNKNKLSGMTLPSPDLSGNWASENVNYSDGVIVTDFEVTYEYLVSRAYTLTDNDVVMENGIMVSADYPNYYRKLVIPSFLDSQMVIGIGDEVFYSKKLTNVSLPTTLTSIGSYAFYYTPLTNIILPEGLTTIENSAFSRNSLTSIVLPDGLTNISRYAFSNNNLTSIIFPNGLIDIKKQAFSQNNLTSITLPIGLTNIGPNAFSNNSLDSMTLSTDLTSIGSDAFSNNNLTSISLPTDLTSIGSDAFSENNLTSMTLPSPSLSGNWTSGTTTFVDGAVVTDFNVEYKYFISGIYTLTDSDVVMESGTIMSADYPNYYREIIIPNSLNGQKVIGIGFKSFYQNNLTSITLPEDLTSIGISAFSNNNLTSITLPGGLTTIDHFAFGNNSLTSVVIPEGVTSIEPYAFGKNNLASISLPKSLVNIGVETFSNNSLANITLPDRLTSIGKNAFIDNPLASFVLPSLSFPDLYEVGWQSSRGVSLNEGEDVTDFSQSYTVAVSFKGVYINILIDGDYNANVTITGDADEGVSGIKSHNFLVDKGSDVSIVPQSLEDGYGFYPVMTKISNIQHNQTQVFTYGTSTFTLTYVTYGATHINPASSIQPSIFTLNPASKPYYTFKGWYLEDTFSSQVSKFTTENTGSVTFFAKFKANDFTISYSLEGGVHNNPVTYTIESATITLSDATKKGYSFNGWYEDDTFTVNVTEITTGSTGDISLFAKFTVENYTITYIPNGGDHNNNTYSYTVESEVIVLTEANKAGYTFGGWYTEEKFISLMTEIETGSTGDLTLFAKFAANEYTITYFVDEGDHNNPVTYTIESDTIILSDATKIGFTFSGWYEDENFTTPITYIATGSIGDIKLFSQWEIITDIDEIMSELAIYPNPGTNELIIKGYHSSLRIFNTEGRMMKNFSSIQDSYDISDLTIGTYILQIEVKGGTVIDKVIKK